MIPGSNPGDRTKLTFWQFAVYIHLVLTPNVLKCKSSVTTYSATPFFTKEAINASAIGTFACARRRLPAVSASFSSKGTVLNPFSFSTLSLVLAASSPILAPTYLINSVRTIEGANSCLAISFSTKFSTFAPRASVGGNSKVSSRRVSATLVNASFSGLHQVP